MCLLPPHPRHPHPAPRSLRNLVNSLTECPRFLSIFTSKHVRAKIWLLWEKWRNTEKLFSKCFINFYLNFLSLSLLSIYLFLFLFLRQTNEFFFPSLSLFSNLYQFAYIWDPMLNRGTIFPRTVRIYTCEQSYIRRSGRIQTRLYANVNLTIFNFRFVKF